VTDAELFAYTVAPHAVRNDIADAHRACWHALGRPGTHWDARARVAIARHARAARSGRSTPRWLRRPVATDGPFLPEAAASAARTLAVDAHRIDRAWVRLQTDSMGDGAYVELASLVAQICAVDAFAEALGCPRTPLPEPTEGAPAGGRAEGLGDIGAFVPMIAPFSGPNIGRALSLVPRENERFLGLVGSMYALADFRTLVWNRPLSRPQVELVATRVSAVNECFY